MKLPSNQRYWWVRFWAWGRKDLGQELLGIQAWLLVSAFPFLGLGSGFGLGGAGLGHTGGLPVLGIVPCLPQGAMAGFGA